MDRPGYHLTAPEGHVNDPLGVTWTGERYHLFHQLNPDAPVWTVRCRWGQVDGPDLVRWQRPRVALAPDGNDEGCWSGTVAVESGVPTILYTSVRVADPGHGRIVAAFGDKDFERWAKDAGGPLLDGPPAGLGVTAFRDPYVLRDGDGWRMVVGAGLDDGRGAVLQYRSPDLCTWTFDGVLCARSGTERDGQWTGTVWECPQLVEVDGAWVLVVSVWDDGLTQHVSYAVGDHDGTRFVPRSWHRFAHGDSLYATSCFVDAAGRTCAISWSRDAGPPAGRVWAGALSVPYVLGRDGDRLTVAPHPDVDTLRGAVVAEHADPPEARSDTARRLVVDLPAEADIVLVACLPDPADRLELALGGAATLVLDVHGVTVTRPGLPAMSWPSAPADGRFEVRLLLDGDVLEVFAGGEAGAVRFPDPADPTRAVVSGPARIESLTVWAMERCFPR